MISFHHSSPYYSTHHHLVYPDDAFSSPFAYQPLYSSYLSRSTDPEMRYRRSLAEYLAAEKEYNTILRSREEAILRARADALYRQEQMRLHLAQVVRARKEQKARQLEEALAKAQAEDLAAQTTVPIFPVVFSVPHHNRTTVPATRKLSSHSSPVNDPTGLPDPMPQSDIKVQAEPEHAVDESKRLCHFLHEMKGGSIPTLETFLKNRLQKIAGDEEVRDVARAIIHLLDQGTSVTGHATGHAPPSEEQVDCIGRSSDGADLSRSDAFQGTTAETAKASFRAHRAAAVENTSPVPPKRAPSPHAAIQGIRTTLAQISADFSLPQALDFSDKEADGLAYSPVNAPIRMYEHALDELLAQLDAVESDGDEDVRLERRAAVKEVEKAIDDVERKVREARELTKEGTTVGVLVPAEVLPKTNLGDDDNKPRAGAPAVSIGDDNTFVSHSSPASLSTSDSEGLSSPVATHARPASGIDTLEDASPFPILDSTAKVAAAPTPSPEPITALAKADRPSGDGALESARNVAVEQFSPALSKRSSFPMVSETPTNVATPAIPPTSTPVSPVLPPSSLPEDDLVPQLSVSLRHEGDEASSDDADDEGEWSEVEA